MLLIFMLFYRHPFYTAFARTRLGFVALFSLVLAEAPLSGQTIPAASKVEQRLDRQGKIGLRVITAASSVPLLT